MRISLNFPKIIACALAFILLPLIVGLASTAISSVDLMDIGLDDFSAQGMTSPSYDRSKPTAVILVSNEGTEPTDLLVPYEVFSASDRFNVYTVAPKRQISPLLGGVDIIPHFSFEELDATLASGPDLIIIPAVHNPKNPALVQWIIEHNTENTVILSICEGARLLAATGLLENHQATTHSRAIASLKKQYPNTDWVKGVQYLEDGNIITSPGVVTGAMNGSLYTLSRFAGEKTAKDVANQLHYPLTESTKFEPTSLTLSDTVWLLTAAYGWRKQTIGVFVDDGIGEIDLTSVLDTYPRSFAARVTSVASERKIFRSRHGLALVPRNDFTAPPQLDRILVLDNHAHKGLDDWAKDNYQLDIEYLSSLSNDSDEFVFDPILRDLEQQENQPLAQVVAKTMEYRFDFVNPDAKGFPTGLLLKPLALGLGGVGIVLMVDLWLLDRKKLKERGSTALG